jgi:hypothetical protein
MRAAMRCAANLWNGCQARLCAGLLLLPYCWRVWGAWPGRDTHPSLCPAAPPPLQPPGSRRPLCCCCTTTGGALSWRWTPLGCQRGCTTQVGRLGWRGLCFCVCVCVCVLGWDGVKFGHASMVRPVMPASHTHNGIRRSSVLLTGPAADPLQSFRRLTPLPSGGAPSSACPSRL